MKNVEVGKAYRLDGGSIWKITEVRPDGTVCGSRWIKTTQKFSGQAYVLWATWLGNGREREAVEVANPEAAH